MKKYSNIDIYDISNKMQDVIDMEKIQTNVQGKMHIFQK